MPMVAGIIMLSPDIVVLVSGKAFEQSYASLQILSVAIAFSLIAAFFSSGVLLPNKKDRKILTATIISAIVNLSLNFILIPVCNEKGAALTIGFGRSDSREWNVFIPKIFLRFLM